MTPQHGQPRRDMHSARIFRFILSAIRLRSISRALWVRAYDTFKPTHGGK